MSRFMRGDSVEIMANFPDNSIDFILTDPPYLVGFKDRSGRSIAGDVSDEWVLPASQQGDFATAKTAFCNKHEDKRQ